MQYKTVFHSRPDILWFVTEREKLSRITKFGIKPALSQFELPGVDDEKVICAVHLGEYEKAKTLAKMEDLEDPVIIEFVAKTYYECASESPETYDEYEFIAEQGHVHVGLCIVLDKVKPKWISGWKELLV